MSLIYLPSKDRAPTFYEPRMLREPRLMVPGTQPLGRVKIAANHRWWVHGAFIGNTPIMNGVVLTYSPPTSGILERKITDKGIAFGQTYYTNTARMSWSGGICIRTIVGQFIDTVVSDDSSYNWYDQIICGGSTSSTAYMKLISTGTQQYNPPDVGCVGVIATEGSSPFTAFSHVAAPVTANRVTTAAACIKGAWGSDTSFIAVGGKLYTKTRNLQAPYSNSTNIVWGNTGAASVATTYILMGAWSDKELPEGLLNDLSIDPYQIFEPA